jgi:polar amino acid transport system permease protein
MFFIDGAKLTILLALCTVFFGVIIGVVLALMKISKNKILNSIAAIYIEFIRGTPVLVQVAIIYYALPDVIGINLPEFPAAVAALAINSGAYVAEIIRAGIQAVDKGQMEASRSLGLTYGMSMRYVIIPQAIKNILPALGNEFIVVIKESSVVMVIGLKELMFNADLVRGNTFRAFEPLLIAAFIYFIMTFTLSKIMGRVERSMRNSD